MPIGPPDDRALRLRTADEGVLIIDRRATETEANARIFTFELDRRADVMWGSGDVLWFLEPDEFDVPWLVRYRLVS